MAIEFKDKSTKLLQNKSIEGGLASATSWLTLPRGTTAKLASLVRRVGAAAFDLDQNSLVIDDGTGFQPVSGSDEASAVSYDNTASGLSAADVQAAIDELAATPSGPVSTKVLINIMESINGNVVASNVPFTFTKTGDLVVCQIGAFSGTAPFNWTFFYEFIPAEFRPYRSITVPYAVQLNADPLSFGFFSVGTSGHLDFSGPDGGTFTGGTGTVPAFTVSWLVSEPA